METKEMIETLRYKANNIKAKIDPKFFNDCANALEELKEYKELEEQGLLKKFDCAIGDTVYKISNTRPVIYECTVQGIRQEFNTTSYFLHADINEEVYSIWVDNWFDRCQIGYAFYLTKEAAEKALKKLIERND